MKLDAKTVAALRLAGKRDAIFFDDDLPGFGFRLRLSAGGKIRKSWIAQYRRAGSSRRLLLGAGDVLSAEQARGMAKKIFARIALGEDPQADRIDRHAKDRLSMRSQVPEFLAAKEPELRPPTLAELRRYLTDPRYFGPLQTLPIDTIARRDIAARLVVITRESGRPTAARARGALGSFLTWCMRMGLIESNPTIGVVKPAESAPRSRVLSDDELRRIWRACGDDDYGRIVRLMILLGARRQACGGCCWSELDLERGTWTLPAARSKNKRAHTLPLMPVALDIIQRIPRMVSRDALFGQRSHGFTMWAGGKHALDERSGVRDWVLHDVRRSVATRMADLGVQPHIIEAILGHVGHKAGVAGVYNRSPYEREVRAALGMWEDHLRTLVAGGERKILPYAPAVS